MRDRLLKPQLPPRETVRCGIDGTESGRGTEYNPDMVDVILSDRELYNDLKMLTEQNRENIYYDIYLTFVNLRKKRQ